VPTSATTFGQDPGARPRPPIYWDLSEAA